MQNVYILTLLVPQLSWKICFSAQEEWLLHRQQWQQLQQKPLFRGEQVLWCILFFLALVASYRLKEKKNKQTNKRSTSLKMKYQLDKNSSTQSPSTSTWTNHIKCELTNNASTNWTKLWYLCMISEEVALAMYFRQDLLINNKQTQQPEWTTYTPPKYKTWKRKKWNH